VPVVPAKAHVDEATEEQPTKPKKSSKKASKSKPASPEPAPLTSPAAADRVPFDAPTQVGEEADDTGRRKSSRGGSQKSVRLGVAASPQRPAEAISSVEHDSDEVCSSLEQTQVPPWSIVTDQLCCSAALLAGVIID
jgi:hypothetical protein